MIHLISGFHYLKALRITINKETIIIENKQIKQDKQIRHGRFRSVFSQTERVYKTHVGIKISTDQKSTNLSLSHKISEEVRSYNIQIVICYK